MCISLWCSFPLHLLLVSWPPTHFLCFQSHMWNGEPGEGTCYSTTLAQKWPTALLLTFSSRRAVRGLENVVGHRYWWSLVDIYLVRLFWELNTITFIKYLAICWVKSFLSNYLVFQLDKSSLIVSWWISITLCIFLSLVNASQSQRGCFIFRVLIKSHFWVFLYKDHLETIWKHYFVKSHLRVSQFWSEIAQSQLVYFCFLILAGFSILRATEQSICLSVWILGSPLVISSRLLCPFLIAVPELFVGCLLWRFFLVWPGMAFAWGSCLHSH